MTVALTAILALAAAQVEAMIRPDSRPLQPQELAALDQLDADLRHPGPRRTP